MNSINFSYTKLIQISEKYCCTTMNNMNPSSLCICILNKTCNTHILTYSFSKSLGLTLKPISSTKFLHRFNLIHGKSLV